MPEPQETSKKPVLIIIGNGIAGITAARVARILHPDLIIRIVSEESDYFFSRTALMYIYMGHMRQQDTEPYERSFYERNRLELIRDRVEKIDTASKKIQLKAGESLAYDILLIASGSKPNMFGWPGQDLKGVGGLYSLQDLESTEEASRRMLAGEAPRQALLVGGGLIGIELAEMLISRDIPVTFLVRENRYMPHVLPPEESEIILQEIKHHHVDIRLGVSLKEIRDDGHGWVGSIITDGEEEIKTGFVGLTAGVGPNLELVKDNDAIETARGILVDAQMQTSHADVFAVGDCAQLRNADGTPGRVFPLWYTGRMMGETAGKNLAARACELTGGGARAEDNSRDEYNPGTWFNSAKFFTIEYQTYGVVPTDGKSSLYWQNEEGRVSLRLCYEEREGKRHISGFNAMGLRLRQDVCTAWIEENRTLEEVLGNLEEAAFDAEFSVNMVRRAIQSLAPLGVAQ